MDTPQDRRFHPDMGNGLSAQKGRQPPRKLLHRRWIQGASHGHGDVGPAQVFVQEVAGQNGKNVSLEDIQKIDTQWKEAEDELPIQAEIMSNACAQEIRRIAKGMPILSETFVMDNQGANVGQNALTSDYWQGDEAKWKNSYKDARGGIDVGKRKLDKSTNVVDQKVSLPIISEPTGAPRPLDRHTAITSATAPYSARGTPVAT